MTVQKDVCFIRVYGKMFEPIYNGLFSFLSSQYNGYYDPFVLFDAIQFDKLNKRPYAVLFRFLSTYVKSKLMHFWGFYEPICVLMYWKYIFHKQLCFISLCDEAFFRHFDIKFNQLLILRELDFRLIELLKQKCV